MQRRKKITLPFRVGQRVLLFIPGCAGSWEFREWARIVRMPHDTGFPYEVMSEKYRTLYSCHPSYMVPTVSDQIVEEARKGKVAE